MGFFAAFAEFFALKKKLLALIRQSEDHPYKGKAGKQGAQTFENPLAMARDMHEPYAYQP